MLRRSLGRLAVQDSDLADAQCGTIRTWLLKFGAPIRITVRCFCIACSQGCLAKALCVQALRNLQEVSMRTPPA